MPIAKLLIILALVCFAVEALRGNFRPSPGTPPRPPLLIVGWGWFGLGLYMLSKLIDPSSHL